MAYMNMALLTWPEAERFRTERAIGLIPAGSFEQHGPHLPLSTDTLIAEVLARMLAQRAVEPVVVAPVIQATLSDHHLGFPGTVTVSVDVLAGQLLAFIHAFNRMHIRDVAIITSHGGNFAFLKDFTSSTRQSLPDTRLIAYDDFAAYIRAMVRGANERNLAVPDCDVHAGGLETSQALYLFPEFVHPFTDVSGYTEARDGWLATLFEQGVRALSSSGVVGRPADASAEAGESIMNSLCDELFEWMSAEFGLQPQEAARSPFLSRDERK